MSTTGPGTCKKHVSGSYNLLHTLGYSISSTYDYCYKNPYFFLPTPASAISSFCWLSQSMPPSQPAPRHTQKPTHTLA